MNDESYVYDYLQYAEIGEDLSDVRFEFHEFGCRIYQPIDDEEGDKYCIDSNNVDPELWSKFVAEFGCDDLEAKLDMGWTDIVQDRLSPKRQAILDACDACKERNEHLFNHITEVLYEYDIVNLSMFAPADEYDPEAGTILVRYEQTEFTATTEELAEIVREEFVEWFGDIGSRDTDYIAIANEIINRGG